MNIVVKALGAMLLLAAVTGHAGDLIVKKTAPLQAPPVPAASAPVPVVKPAAAPASAASAAMLTVAPTPAAVMLPANVQLPVIAQLPTEWRVTELDGTIRQTLEKWATLNNWIFRSEHWTVQRDFPVQGAMKFTGDFKTAVRLLLSSTDLTDQPVQPCFYTNHVLRVVDRAEVCDRMSGVNGTGPAMFAAPVFDAAVKKQ